MQCKFCGFGNGEDDHRCLRCGRRVAGRAVAAPTGYNGALALAPLFDPDATLDSTVDPKVAVATQSKQSTDSFFPPLQSAAEAKAAAPRAPGRVIPFDRHQRQLVSQGTATPPPPETAAPVDQPAVAAPRSRSMAEMRASEEYRPQKPAPRAQRKDQTRELQANFDFVAAPPEPPTLKTGVVGQVSCPQTVAKPIHRCLAGAVDAAAILIAFGVFMGTASLCGASFGEGKLVPFVLGANLAAFAVFYGVVCLIMRHDTVGMDMVQLQLVTFEGHPVDARTRLVRFMTSLVSIGAAGLGMIWALADEENLTWHDHISKSFPTAREGGSSYLRAGRT